MNILDKIQAKMAALIGDISVSWSNLSIWPYPSMVIGHEKTLSSGRDYRLFNSLIKPGDMIVTTQIRAKGSNKAIPGAFKHLMVVTGTVKGAYDQNTGEIKKPKSLGTDRSLTDRSLTDEFDPEVFKRTITHAESEGIGTYDLYDVFLHYDYLCAIRPWKTAEEQQKIVDYALSKVGTQYDFKFQNVKDSSFYCTELGVRAIQEAGIADLPNIVKLTTRFYKPFSKSDVVIADMFVAKYDVVCTTISCNDPKITRSSLVADILREKLLKAPDASVSR